MPRLEVLLAQAKAALVEKDVATPALDARLLVQHVLGISHAELISESNRQITDDQSKLFAALLARRLAGEPVTRILGEREFFGRSFRTSPEVLDPRPDTEALIELCLDHLSPHEHQSLLDLGTGSGILAITLLAERPSADAVAVDVSAGALAVARENARLLAVAPRVQFMQGSWFENVEGRFDLIVSNPPYIPSHELAGLEIEVRSHDPHLALDGGQDGLACYRAIAGGAAHFLKLHGLVAVEIGAGQKAGVEAIFQNEGFTLTAQRQDLGGHTRALVFRR